MQQTETKLPPVFQLARKIQMARRNMLALNLHKTTDEFSGVSQFSPETVLPHALHILDELDVFTLVSIDEKLAVIKAIDMETGCDIQVVLPVPELKPLAQTPVQALGLMAEHLRCLLYVQLLEFYEGDS